jgi:hypothetical protein
MAVDASVQSQGGQPAADGTTPNAEDFSAADAAEGQQGTPPSPQQLRELRAEAAKWRRMYQTARTAEEELGRLKAAGQSELERANSRGTEAETRAGRAELDLRRLQIGLETGLVRQRQDGTWDTTLALRLAGSTEEELRADAIELAKVLPPAGQQQQGQQGQGQGRRVPNASQNANGAGPNQADPSAWLRDKLTAGR